MENRNVEGLNDPYALEDKYLPKSLKGIKWTEVYDIPPYDLTVPSDKVKEIKLPKPTGKIFWNNSICDTKQK